MLDESERRELVGTPTKDVFIAMITNNMSQGCCGLVSSAPFQQLNPQIYTNGAILSTHGRQASLGGVWSVQANFAQSKQTTSIHHQKCVRPTMSWRGLISNPVN